MKAFIKENIILLLFLLLLGLLFVFWGRIVIKEFRVNMYANDLTTQKARLSCLLNYGWEGDPGSETVKTLLIPDPLDAVFEKYNQLSFLKHNFQKI